MKTIRFGIIGCGLMGREFVSAAARWCHLTDMPARPEIVAVCNRSDKPFAWLKANVATITQYTHDYKQLLANPDVDAVYIAVPHDKHEEIYCAAIEAGKHLLGEKPFGIDLAANEAINRCIAQHSDVFVRCVSQIPFYPAVQKIGSMIESGELGRIIEVESGFLHSSDLDADKPINWKRMVQFNGEYGVLGDLGMHACHVPFRAGWRPRNVRAVLSNIMAERYASKDSKEKVPCETWDNGTLLCEMQDPVAGDVFPWTFKAFRISPGEKNTWYIRILGTKASVRFNLRNPRLLETLHYDGSEQVWKQVQMGMDTAYPQITGGIFEFGFTDAIQQMWAAFICELETGKIPSNFAGCVRPDEVAISHKLFTAALRSQKENATVSI